jgi:hypothetical protein
MPTNPSRREPMSEEVRNAVNDLLHGTGTGSAQEWLQREYIRLMRREASYKQHAQYESKLKRKVENNNGDHSESNRTD